jgi:hypothetical protein
VAGVGAIAFGRLSCRPVRADLQGIVDRAADGDVVALPGEQSGPVKITRKLTLEGETGAAITGSGKGSVVTILVPEAILRGLTIRGSGKDMERMDAGVFVEQAATGAIVDGDGIADTAYRPIMNRGVMGRAWLDRRAAPHRQPAHADTAESMALTGLGRGRAYITTANGRRMTLIA